MPRVRQLTPDMRRDADRERQRVRLRRIIETSAKYHGKSLRKLAKEVDCNYNTFVTRLKVGNMRLEDFTDIAEALDFDDSTIVACIRKNRKCQFDTRNGVHD